MIGYYSIVSLLLDLIFPRFCYGCGQEGDYLCQKCSARIPTLSAKKSDKFDGMINLFSYTPPLSLLIKDLKFGLVTDIVPVLSSLAVTRLHSDFPNLVDYWQSRRFSLIPIPLHRHRQNWRGFNQSDLPGRQIAKGLNLGFDNKLLSRPKPTSPQSLQTSITSRSQNLHFAFSLTRPIIDGNYLLFDDVSTSGATFASAAAALSQSTKINTPPFVKGGDRGGFKPSYQIWCLSLCLG